ncbi:hypothetical protein GCM10023217_19490 [Gordonia alkaliphila]|uniref:Uncharacterized protein n=1 Tax=Gordonia alkaliphila TaxID=1053547 RepID=A0ABP8Z8C9_9ACTN
MFRIAAGYFRRVTQSPLRQRVSAVGDRLRGTVVVEILVALGRVGVSDRAMTLAGQAFTSLLPVLILITTLSSDGPVGRAMRRISTQWLELEMTTPSTDESTSATFGILGVLMVLIGATSFTRALDRMYAEVWALPKLGLAGWWRWPLIIGTLVAGITAEVFGIRNWPFGGELVVQTVFSFVLWTLVWATIIRLLTAGRIDGRAVVATGLATGAAVALFFLVTTIGFGDILDTAENRFGTLGVVFSVIGWLFVYSGIVVTAATVMHVLLTWHRPPTR